MTRRLRRMRGGNIGILLAASRGRRLDPSFRIGHIIAPSRFASAAHGADFVMLPPLAIGTGEVGGAVFPGFMLWQV